MNFSAMFETAKFASETARPAGPGPLLRLRGVQAVEHDRAEADDRRQDVQHEQRLEDAGIRPAECKHALPLAPICWREIPAHVRLSRRATRGSDYCAG